MMAGNSPGIRLEDLHTLRYQCAVKKEGRKILYVVFCWSYLGGNLSVEDFLFQKLEFSNRQFTKIFNLSQRTRLTSPDPVSSYDVTLLYVLLRHICDFDKDDQVWTTEDRLHPKLENLLFQVKQHRNILAHEDLTMSEQEMNDKLDKLLKLFKGIILAAGTRFSISETEVNYAIQTTEENINALRHKIREPLGPTDISELQQEFQEIQEQVKVNIQELSRAEVERLYARLCVLDPVPWLLMDLKVKVSDIFTYFYLKKESRGMGGEEEQRQLVHCNDVFTVKDQNVLPDIIIFVGEGGIGKSTYLKYLTETWLNDPSSIKGLNDIELLLYVECRHPTLKSFEELLKHILHGTCQKMNVEFTHLRECVLHMQILILIDGFDEVNDASFQLVQEVLNLPNGNIRVMITTRPGGINAILKLVPIMKEKIALTIEGISSDHHLDVIEKHCRNLVKEEEFISLKPLLQKQMWFMSAQFGTHLNNPLTLALIALLFLQDPHRTDKLSTSTQLYVELRKLLTEKLTERLIVNKPEPDVEHRCLQFLKYSDELSFRALQRREYELRDDTVGSLKGCCRKLSLLPEEVLPAYFTVRHSRNGLINVVTYAYHHLRLQEFAAANHIYDTITASSDVNVTVQDLVAQASQWKFEGRFQSVLTHLSGLLAASSEEILRDYAEDLFSLVQLNSTNIDLLLAHVVESKYNPHVVEAAARKLEQHALKWSGWLDIRERNQLDALSPLLNKINFRPERVTLAIHSQTDVKQHSEVVKTLSQKVSELTVDMHNHYSGSIDIPSDMLVINMAESGGTCKLVAFRGALSTAGIRMLPSCISELRLRVSVEVLHSLNETLPNLQQLHILGLQYVDAVCTSPEQVPSLMYKGKTLWLCICSLITDAEEDVHWCCGVLAKMCSSRPNGTCSNIVLKTTQLTFIGCERLLRGLYQSGVRVERNIDIYSSGNLTQEQRKILHKMSEELYLGTLLFRCVTCW